MLKILRKIPLIAALAAISTGFIPTPLYAQASSNAQPGILPISSRDLFPILPPSSVCSKEKLVGMWKLLMVYEIPAGKEISTYIDNPMQYFVFEPDTRYGEYKSILNAITLKDIRNDVLTRSEQTQQFAINQSGMVFFYKNGVAVDSLACFIAANNTGPFRAGQLLLMPPQKAAAGARMLKVYQKVFLEFEAPYCAPADGQAPIAAATQPAKQTTK